MDTIFYLTIISGILTVILSVTTYYKGKQKELEADTANQNLLNRTSQVAELQEKLLTEMEKTQSKSDSIISIQTKLQDANDKILSLSNENVKQVLGNGAPTLSAHFFPDKLISLFIENKNEYPIYDLSLNFPNPDPTHAVDKMVATNSNLSWEDMRNQWINISAFNLPPKTGKNFYSFILSERMDQTVFFLNIVSRHGAFSGRVVIKRKKDTFTFQSEVKDLQGKLLTQLNAP